MPLTVGALGPLREADVPTAAVDFHCSDVVKAVCERVMGGGDGAEAGGLAAARAALEGASAALGAPPDDLLMRAMWEFRGGVNARSELAGAPTAGGGARAELEDVWRACEGEVERWSRDYVSQKFL